jgi:MFS transporter, ACS family, allantoate permease
LSAQNNGQQGWRLINYFLGAVTIFDGILLLIFLGTPSEVWWLNAEQKKMAHARVVSNATGGGEQHPWKWSQVRECFRDPQFYFAVYFNLAATIPNGALGAFSPLVYTSFGFTNFQAILFGLPSNAIGCIFILVSAAIVTKQPKARFPLALLWNITPMIVFLYVGLATDAGQWQKWACFSFVSVFAIATFMTWSIIPLNTAGRTKKSFLSACVGDPSTLAESSCSSLIVPVTWLAPTFSFQTTLHDISRV